MKYEIEQSYNFLFNFWTTNVNEQLFNVERLWHIDSFS